MVCKEKPEDFSQFDLLRCQRDNLLTKFTDDF